MSNPITEAFVGANILVGVYQFLPRVFASIVLFLVGLFVAKIVKKIVVKILESINLTKLAKDTTFEKFLEKAEVKSKIEEIIGAIVNFLIVLVFVVTSINVLGIPTLSGLLNSILAYIPNVISTIFVLALGTLLAGVIESLVKGSVGQFDGRTSRMLGKVASYVMMVFTVMAAFNELGIAEEFMNILFIGFVSMISLGLGLAIGLGAKDVVSEFLTNWYKNLKMEVKEGKRKKK